MKLLVVEDEKQIRDLLSQSLVDAGHEVLVTGSTEEAMTLLQRVRVEGYVLDVTLPGLSGVELCRWLRNQGVKEPILMLTASSGLSDKVEGLNAGADDYLTKPFELAELKARLHAFERKSRGYPRPILQVADLVIDPNQMTVRRRGKTVDLSRKEFLLLDYLARNQDRVVTRAMIAAAVWESNTSLYTNVIDVFIANLRRKLDDGFDVRLIHTVRGKGFLLAEVAPGSGA